MNIKKIFKENMIIGNEFPKYLGIYYYKKNDLK
jgi:hypothetical protein